MGIIIVIVGAIVGAASAFIFNLFHWRIVEKRHAITAIGNALIEIISHLEESAIDYWLCADISNLKKLEISIKSYNKVNRKLISELNSKISNNVYTSTKVKLTNFGNEIFDLTTGGDFETEALKNEPVKAAKISLMCSSTKADILKMMY
jgi:hypothetical protein